MLSQHCACVVALHCIENNIWFVFEVGEALPQLQNVTAVKSPSYICSAL
jgi:hypothetical protein